MRLEKLALALILTVAVAPALVAAVCIPPATGVFGNATPPDWWDPIPPQAIYAHHLDDPRWVGAGVLTYGDGTATQADFRALHDNANQNLFLSWRVFLAPAMNANQNTLYVGFERAGGAGPMVISVSLPTLVPSEDVAGSTTANVLNNDGSLGGALNLPWLSNTRVWINNPTANSFAVQMLVPIGAVDVSASNFNMWYELLIGTPSSPQFPFAWPRTSFLGPPSMLGQIATFPVPTSPGAWDAFRLSTGPSDPNCANSGVSLDVYQIGTTNSPSYQVNYSTTLPKPVNTFFARATNNSGAPINAGTLRARFRLANWGSMPGDESSADPNALWATIPGGDDVGNANAIPNATTANASNDNHFDWTLSNADIVPFENGTRSRDNCLLVELTSTTGLTFTNNSIRRNMSFVSASKFVHRAEISIKGLTPIAAVGRDVYLLVETANMPAVVKTPPPPPPPGLLNEPNGHEMTPAQYEAAAAAGRLTEAQMDSVIPTYRVHVFYDSGKAINGHPILIPQGGFGYRVIHNGDLLGWAHETVGEDVTLTEVAPNFYKISHVPNDGVVHVITTIEAREHGQSSPSGTWRFFVDAGGNSPNGALDGRFSINAGLERRLTNNWSIEGILGYHAFDAVVDDVHAWQLSANAKYFFGTSALQPFVNAGVGVYRVDPPDDTEFGFNAGAGLLWNVDAKWGVEAAYNHHSTDPVDWSTLQLGLRWSF